MAKVTMKCINCLKPFLVEETSRRRLCLVCCNGRIDDSIKQLRNRKGKYYNKWKSGLINVLKEGDNNGKGKRS